MALLLCIALQAVFCTPTAAPQGIILSILVPVFLVLYGLRLKGDLDRFPYDTATEVCDTLQNACGLACDLMHVRRLPQKWS